MKVGSASLVGRDGELDDRRLIALCDAVADARKAGLRIILVSSGAIAAGMGPLHLAMRPTDIPTLQATAAVGQGRLLGRYAEMMRERGGLVAQILLTQHDFIHRGQYLNARNTIERLLALGVLPIVNENDTVATDEIRFGDNDRLAALVANLVDAKMLLLLTDAKGVHSSDPRLDPDAPLLDEVERITPELERAAGGRGSGVATGGMSSKVAAAWVATFSGVGVVVADASEPRVIERVTAGEKVGTYFHPRPHRVSARRLWIAFAQPPAGTIRVDEGARSAVVDRKKSLLPAGVVSIEGVFPAGATVDVATTTGVFARGTTRYSSQELDEAKGLSTGAFQGREVIQRDHLVVLE